MYGGEIRKGDNLFPRRSSPSKCSGKLRWHYQVVRHDLWDADIATPPVLYDAQQGEAGGRPWRRCAPTDTSSCSIARQGSRCSRSRSGGSPGQIPEHRGDAAVSRGCRRPAAGLPLLQGQGAGAIRARLHRLCASDAEPALIVAPGTPIPRVRVTPMAFSPQTGYFYAQGMGQSDGPSHQRRSMVPGRRRTGRLAARPVGIVAAIDSRTNRIVWKKEVAASELGGSGPLTTAGGLMFRASADGRSRRPRPGAASRCGHFKPVCERRGARQRPMRSTGSGTGPSQWAPCSGHSSSADRCRRSRRGCHGTARRRRADRGDRDGDADEGAVRRRRRQPVRDGRACVQSRARPRQARHTRDVRQQRTHPHTLAAQDGWWNTVTWRPRSRSTCDSRVRRVLLSLRRTSVGGNR